MHITFQELEVDVGDSLWLKLSLCLLTSAATVMLMMITRRRINVEDADHIGDSFSGFLAVHALLKLFHPSMPSQSVESNI